MTLGALTPTWQGTCCGLRESASTVPYGLSANAPLSIMYAEQAINRGMDISLAQGWQAELRGFSILGLSKDREEGMAAFREKRSPKFSGG